MTDTLHHQRIHEHLERGQLALFLGADLPREVTGLPNRADLARGLAQRHGLDGAQHAAPLRSLAQVAQRVARGGNRFDFTSYLRDQLDTTGLSPRPFHRRIANLVRTHRVSYLITTAYDDLLERAFRDAGVGFNRVVRGSDVSFIDPNRATLIRLYGDAAQPDTLVVTEDDHYGLWRDRDKEDLLDEVRQALRRNGVLFLGYNLSDPDFNLLWREVLDRAGEFAKGAFAVWPGLAEGDAAMWRDRGITILETDPLGITDGGADLPTPPEGPDATVPSAAEGEGPTWDTEAVRQLLSAAFSDGELTTLCFDHFRPVYEDFGTGMGKGAKIQRLLDHCVRHDLLDDLLDQVAQRNPAQYERFAPRLSSKESSQDSTQQRIKQVQEGKDAERIEAARALRSLGAVEAIPALVELMAYDPARSPETIPVRNAGREALIALGQHHHTQVVEAMREALADRFRHRYIRRRAVDVLGELRAAEALDDIIALVDDSDADLRRRVAIALGKLGGPQAMQALERLADDADSAVRETALEAIEGLIADKGNGTIPPNVAT